MAAVDKKGVPLAVTPWWHRTLASATALVLGLLAIYLLFKWAVWKPYYLLITTPAAILLGYLFEWVFYKRYLTVLKKRLREFKLAICLRCCYGLHGLPESHSCPECGEPFTMNGTKEHWRKWLSRQFRPTLRQLLNFTSIESCIQCGGKIHAPSKFLCEECCKVTKSSLTI